MASSTISASEARCFLECPRKHYHRYVLRQKPLRTSDALTLGSAVHRALDVFWTGGTLVDSLAMLRIDDPMLLAAAKAMMRGYYARWPQSGEGVLGVEQEFKATLRNPDTGRKLTSLVCVGKVDVVCADRLIEHKTTSKDISPGSDYYAALTIDHQVGLYMNAYPNAEKVIYDVLRKPTLRGKKEETPEAFEERCVEQIAAEPEKFYQRIDLTRTEHEMGLLMADIVSVYRGISQGVRHRNPNACVVFGACEYLDVCIGCADITDPCLFRHAAKKHEELSYGG